jgi:anhydro-N-acetylmuramic acid kinase
MNPELLKCIGLMSGTSLDGIDVAVLETDGEQDIWQGPSLTIPYSDDFRARLRGVLGGSADNATIGAVERDLTLLHAEAVETLIARHRVTGVSLIGFHGHTILHRPELGQTHQIGDGALLADRLGICVVSDFRSADVAAGGQGAPLAPAYHWALTRGMERPLAVLNLGGVGNVTWIGAAAHELIAFDTGPGNAMIDDWVLQHTGRPVDEDGALAARGKVDFDTVRRFLDHPFFALQPPKSLDRDSFAPLMPRNLSIEDGAATLTRATAAAVGRAVLHLPTTPRRWLVTGGGRHNPTLMAALAEELACPVLPVEVVGWEGDALEAQAFAYLAVRSLRARPLSFPGTTGVPSPLSGGRFDYPAHM